MKEKAAYLRGLIEGLGIDETTKEGKVIKAMSELLGELAEAVDGIDEDVTRAYDQINDLSEELEDLEADLYEDDEDDEEPEEEAHPHTTSHNAGQGAIASASVLHPIDYQPWSWVLSGQLCRRVETTWAAGIGVIFKNPAV